MARPLRIEYHVAYYHFGFRDNERKAMFRDDQDRWKFLELLGCAPLAYPYTKSFSIIAGPKGWLPRPSPRSGRKANADLSGRSPC